MMTVCWIFCTWTCAIDDDHTGPTCPVCLQLGCSICCSPVAATAEPDQSLSDGSWRSTEFWTGGMTGVWSPEIWQSWHYKNLFTVSDRGKKKVCVRYLDQQIELSGSPVVQWNHSLTDQRAEVMAQLEDLVEAVKHLKVRVGEQSGLR